MLFRQSSDFLSVDPDDRQLEYRSVSSDRSLTAMLHGQHQQRMRAGEAEHWLQLFKFHSTACRSIEQH